MEISDAGVGVTKAPFVNPPPSKDIIDPAKYLLDFFHYIHI